MNDPATKPAAKRRGCLFYGVVIGLGFLLLILLGVAAGYYSLKTAVDRLTEKSPALLAPIEASPAEAAQAKARVDGFRETVRARLPSPPLVLSARELNALIAYDPEFAMLKDKLRLRIEDGKLRGQISMPLEQTGMPMLKGRYLNGTGTFRVKVNEDRLNVSLEEVEVHGKPLPHSWLSRLRGINLAQKLNEDPHASTAIGTLESIDVKGDQVIITPKRNR